MKMFAFVWVCDRLCPDKIEQQFESVTSEIEQKCSELELWIEVWGFSYFFLILGNYWSFFEKGQKRLTLQRI